MKVLTQEELNKILDKHKKWLNDEEGGEKGIITHRLIESLVIKDGKSLEIIGSEIIGSEIWNSEIWNSEIWNSEIWDSVNMVGSSVDFCTIPLSCDGLNWEMDRRLMAQLAYHFCSHNCDDKEVIEMQNKLLPLANQFHRVDECGEIKER